MKFEAIYTGEIKLTPEAGDKLISTLRGNPQIINKDGKEVIYFGFGLLSNKTETKVYVATHRIPADVIKTAQETYKQNQANIKARMAAEKQYDKKMNDGGDGYNPYR